VTALPSPLSLRAGKKPSAASRRAHFLTALLLCAVLFAIDLKIPLGVAFGVLHVVSVLWLLRVDDRRLSLLLAAVATFFIVVKLAIVDITIAAPWMVYTNRSLSVFVVWIVTLLGMQKHSTEKRLEEIGTMLTVCAWSKQIKVGDTWVPFEEYLTRNLGLTLTHGITEEVAQKLMQDFRRSDS
jgi:hypothetical protein